MVGVEDPEGELQLVVALLRLHQSDRPLPPHTRARTLRASVRAEGSAEGGTSHAGCANGDEQMRVGGGGGGSGEEG